MEYNKVAAKWWADKLRNIGMDNFDNSEVIDSFEKKLADIIKEHLESRGSMTLSVDYCPDYILGSIAQETGVSTNGFLWKTTMWVEKDKVSVKDGYTAPTNIIFPKSAE